jgi:hypothetical protein
MTDKHRNTPEQLAYLREAYVTMSLSELPPAFNAKFGTALTEKQIRSTLRNHRIKSGRTGRFVKGQTSWNLGEKGYMGPNATSFQKGQIPHNHQPLWSERVGKDGYVEMSVPERDPYTGSHTRYKHKHIWLWEQANGPKPKGMAVIFKDGDKSNFDTENLALVTRAELLAMNLHGYKDQPAELKPTVLALAKVEAKAGFRSRPARGRRKKTNDN